ncbi:MAG: hypothetical protein UR28_C0012G0030 [Candidatus Peregrinibacteria bacterium GW2011_GWF2_33_10]|nr:MAG: hypothetical protein UR28_C0012G0030 [Candidatus Peregrinibacteria bacterium GW2011_GWF2_33_10]OGJ44066.1 MAG: hypothetical protein A2263_01530 [Candidatus Peregrinibacteria bacterium RIFOXYA2_FULL_33_21]OGJ45711.1 MAG: hypothetical protein A2272_03825 [Candidatus Peregrinibacteria bacterium RIFOXYA12_FULL_33_12]OGJ51409.1 MAG: hypothetical protein A2307_02575 [Candidatus Peregrinibacteria bacterium RIFOXYB2_FULL_33_20]
MGEQNGQEEGIDRGVSACDLKQVGSVSYLPQAQSSRDDMTSIVNDQPVDKLSFEKRAVRENFVLRINPNLWQLPDNPRLQKYMEQFDELADKGLLDLDVFLSNLQPTDNLEGQTVQDIRAYKSPEDKLKAVKAIAFNRLNTKKNKLYKPNDDMFGNNPTGGEKSCLELIDVLEREGGVADMLGFDDEGRLMLLERELNVTTCNLIYEEANFLIKTTGFDMLKHNKEDKRGWIDLRKDADDRSEYPNLVSGEEALERLLKSGKFSEEALQAMQATDKPIVWDLKEGTWLANKSNSPLCACLNSYYGGVDVADTGSDFHFLFLGVLRLLRV